MNIFSIKCYFRKNLEIDVTENRIFWGISYVKLKPEIHSPGNFLLIHRLQSYGNSNVFITQDKSQKINAMTTNSLFLYRLLIVNCF